MPATVRRGCHTARGLARQCSDLRADDETRFTLAVATSLSDSDDQYTPTADRLVADNERFAETFADGELESAPTRQTAIVTCMDCRLDVPAMLGLGVGEAHIIRNAGGVVTDDVIRSLCLSQRALGTREIVLIHHTACGLQTVTEDGLKSELEAEVGIKPAWSVESFADPHADVRQSVKRIELNPFVPHTDHIRGFVYDVGTGRLDEVSTDTEEAG